MNDMRLSILQNLASTDIPQIMDAAVVHDEVLGMQTDGLAELVYGEGFIITDKGRALLHAAHETDAEWFVKDGCACSRCKDARAFKAFPAPAPADFCHCGEPATADCPCCDRRICTKHLAKAAQALAKAVGIQVPALKTNRLENDDA